ncbi:DUF1178 family protein [Ketogulonicigenium vulgare]|uniref:Protein containing DUF1178 n=1 Tax=Ketogulonicigenium vulgare (strain WSH-001) TaxID=759362 RepID=F9Y872_KETVW|nr:DUF1178 family protein [Ketogulonicigenium vulgare]AEM42358.1 Protein containing DUF1178 [Ketogulonicigenium vulgare WSH-001]ALJ82204.1 hypothetical protein KVH_01540 [Ketogulonicigenium vulgare]ANW34846.1 hypothetical protein KvSKV_01545 [Ketogulonicigenium vulgare]AOZ53442.1 Protein containing DUF1178 [Ketogulonicigenium vulgare]
MIRYTLKCPSGHQFDSWFQSASAFDSLQKAGHLSCATCGAAPVEKALMAPNVAKSGPTAPSNEDQLKALRTEVEANSEYVGMSFATEARRMHAGDAPTRAIYGEAKLDEARALLEDGVPVMPLPFIPTRNTN